MTQNFSADETELLRLHTTWFYSNYNVNIPLMRTVFPSGTDTYLMYNLNGHPYFGVDELDELWQFYARTSTFGLAEDKVLRVDVSGDMGYVVSEGIFPHIELRDADGNDLPEPVHHRLRYRATEVYKRNDGEGNPTWSMWHFHCSPAPDGDEVPPSKTIAEATDARGLGHTTYSGPVPYELDLDTVGAS
ncbi:hypothetical protein GIS00_16225 [Nakamurella sp. YIM 132087]|uniref:Nuclear transport factor 2 family protein n=1 Tax=Nakamurella alba TaxID=2665158 RepID=A0A7K1FQF4_9ACTN|nr:hypothetical protein [Nakamurella alba]MTD15483.1 hypothetical protein [Nakamurella alba]